MSNKAFIAVWLAVVIALAVFTVVMDPGSVGLFQALKTMCIVVVFLSSITFLILSFAAADWRWWRYF
jgi:hypothetical protein